VNEYQRELQKLKEAGLSQSLVRGWFNYNPETGWLTWKSGSSWLGPGTGKGGNRRQDKRAGTKNNGYRRIQIGKLLYLEHRLIWLHVYGSLPRWPNVVDHINNDGSDNRLVNLREATPAQNVINTRRRIGIRNVWQTKTGWSVRLNLNFKTREKACQFAYETMKKFHGEFVSPDMFGITITPHGANDGQEIKRQNGGQP